MGGRCHLESSVHLHEKELSANRVHNELHGSRALVPHRLRRRPKGRKATRLAEIGGARRGEAADVQSGVLEDNPYNTRPMRWLALRAVPLRHSLLLLRCGCGSPRSPLAVKKIVIKGIDSVSKGCTTCHIRLIFIESVCLRKESFRQRGPWSVHASSHTCAPIQRCDCRLSDRFTPGIHGARWIGLGSVQLAPPR